MRINTEQDNQKLLQETYKMARDAKRVAEQSRTLLLWLHAVSLAKSAVFVAVSVVVILGALRAYKTVTTMYEQVNPNQVMQDVLSGQQP